MKVALVHDYLNQYGGAERVLEVLLDLFPQAHIYTLLHSEERTFSRFVKNIHRTSFLDIAIARRYHRPFIPLMPMAISRLDLGDEYDLIISDSAGFAKGIRHGRHAFHLSYCYTPLRYAWEINSYFPNPIFKTFFKPAFYYLRHWDFQAAQRPDVLLAVSNHIAGKIKEYYNRDANVLFPPVDYRRFNHNAELRGSPKSGSYYLAVGRLLHYKKFDLLIEAFRELNLPLKIVGRGPEEGNIKHKASLSSNIEFMPFVTDEELHALYNQAEAFVFPQVEDFGLVAAEAQACGTPVIALARGGALEIVVDGVTGIFFEQQTVEDIMHAVRRFQSMSFDRRQISQASQRFSIEGFKKGILAQIPACLLEKDSLLCA
jgi:glycosyltransferase involved in cell wall biosynthesis